MTEQFLRENCVPFKVAKSLKKIGFDEECVAIWHNDKLHLIFDFDSYANHESLVTNTKSWTWQDCTAPLFQQAFDWFDAMGISGYPYTHGSIGYTIQHSTGSNGSGGFVTRKEAQIACVEKMIEIYKERNR